MTACTSHACCVLVLCIQIFQIHLINGHFLRIWTRTVNASGWVLFWNFMEFPDMSITGSYYHWKGHHCKNKKFLHQHFFIITWPKWIFLFGDMFSEEANYIFWCTGFFFSFCFKYHTFAEIIDLLVFSGIPPPMFTLVLRRGHIMNVSAFSGDFGGEFVYLKK